MAIEINLLIITDGKFRFGNKKSFDLNPFIDELKDKFKKTFNDNFITLNVNRKFHTHGENYPDSVAKFHVDEITEELLSNTDVLFLIGYSGKSNISPQASEVSDQEARIIGKRVKNNGMGIFGTGDHADLGARLSDKIPILKELRDWDTLDSPQSTIDTVNTITLVNPWSYPLPEVLSEKELPGKRIFPVFVRDSLDPGIRIPHPLLSRPGAIIRELPEHLHEGVCQTPAEFVGDWKNYSASSLAKTMAAAGQDKGKNILEPKCYNVIASAVSSKPNQGRVLADSTFHHFTRDNIKPFLEKDGNSNEAQRQDLRSYYLNIVLWLYLSRSDNAGDLIHALYEMAKAVDLNVAETVEVRNGLKGEFADFIERRLSQAWVMELASHTGRSNTKDRWRQALQPIERQEKDVPVSHMRDVTEELDVARVFSQPVSATLDVARELVERFVTDGRDKDIGKLQTKAETILAERYKGLLP